MLIYFKHSDLFSWLVFNQSSKTFDNFNVTKASSESKLVKQEVNRQVSQTTDLKVSEYSLDQQTIATLKIIIIFCCRLAIS